MPRPDPAHAIDPIDLERVATHGWIAEESAWLGEWLLRASEGFTGRGNSVLPLGAPGMPLDDALRRVRQWYARHDVAPRFQVPLPARENLAGALEDRGWTHGHGARVMTAPIGPVLEHTPDVLADSTWTAAVTPEPGPGFLGAYHYRGAPLPEVGRQMLVRGELVRFVTIVDDTTGEVAAIARGSVHREWIGITAVEVVAPYRRRGLGTATLRTLLEWGTRVGARNVYLQVDLTNDGAHAMYLRAGLRDHHTYRYLLAPTD